MAELVGNMTSHVRPEGFILLGEKARSARVPK